MAKRTNGFGLLVKWLVIPVGLGCIGYFLIGPKLYYHPPKTPDSNTPISNSSGNSNLNSLKSELNSPTSGPSVTVTASPAPSNSDYALSRANPNSITDSNSSKPNPVTTSRPLKTEAAIQIPADQQSPLASSRISPISNSSVFSSRKIGNSSKVISKHSRKRLKKKYRLSKIAKIRGKLASEKLAMKKDSGSIGGTMPDSSPMQKSTGTTNTTPGF